jgi:hypothetical protein
MIAEIRAVCTVLGAWVVLGLITFGGWVAVLALSDAGKRRRAQREQLGQRLHFADGPIVVVPGATRRDAIRSLTSPPAPRLHRHAPIPRIWE